MSGFASLDDLRHLDLRVGTVRSARPNREASRPAYVLEIDLGPLGARASSAQLTRNYAPEELIGRQVVCAVNLAPKRVAGVKSEVLILAAISADRGVILLTPERPVENGSLIA